MLLTGEWYVDTMSDLIGTMKALDGAQHERHDVWLKDQRSIHIPLTLQHLVHHPVQHVDQLAR